MKNRIILISTISLIAIGGLLAYNYKVDATCSGGKDCKACTNCKYCKNCSKDGGTCSVCKS